MFRSMVSRRKAFGRAFTIVELLVAVAIVGVLLGLIAPAVMYARASARRVTCSNHLRQLALATQSYHDAWNVFPPWRSLDPGVGAIDRLLPLLEQPPRSLFVAPGWKIPVLVCPSDGWGAEHPAGLSYLMSGGPAPPFFRQMEGLANQSKMVGMHDITDGASRTAGWSERLRDNSLGSDVRRQFFSVSTSSYSERAAARMCNEGPRTPTPGGANDLAFAWPAASLVSISHLLKPNRPYCQGVNGELIKFRTAGSEHTGGVFVAFIDGHVEFVADNIDEEVWFALGTPSGNETSQ